MQYIYSFQQNPLTHCPECNNDLTNEGILIELSDGRYKNWTIPSALDVHGKLLDNEGLVANGLHSATLCRECGGMLIDMDGIEEESL